MGCRGVFFALTPEQEHRLLAMRGDDSVMNVVHEIEESWDKDWLAEADKAWDAMHRCLSDGTLDLSGGSYPLSYVVFGGRQLYFGGDYYVSYRTVAQVVDVADALHLIDQIWLRQRYDAIDPDDYQGVLDDEDFEYTWYWFGLARDLYQRAAKAGRPVVFTVDQ